MSTVTSNQHFTGWDAQSLIVLTTATISIYNGIELLLLTLSRFKDWHTLLFLSLVIAASGVIPYFVGFTCEYWRVIPYWASMLLSTIGWIAVVTGSAVVLYSRLGLILNNERILKFVKWMIIIDAVIFHTPTTVVQYTKIYGSDQTASGRALFYIEKIQMTGFCIQEFIISGLYLWKTYDLLRVVQKEGTRKVMIELFVINVLIVVGDIALLVLEYSGERVMERTWKGFVYSVKLKLEFAILSKLVDLVQSSQRTLSNALAGVDKFVNVTRTNTIGSTQPSTARRESEGMPDWLLKLEDRNIQTLHVEDISIPSARGRQDFDGFITSKEV